MRDMATGRARGFAFVEMGTDEEAQKAITEFHEQQMEGRALVVNEARPKPEGGFGGGGGGRGVADTAAVAGVAAAAASTMATSAAGRRKGTPLVTKSVPRSETRLTDLISQTDRVGALPPALVAF